MIGDPFETVGIPVTVTFIIPPTPPPPTPPANVIYLGPID